MLLKMSSIFLSLLLTFMGNQELLSYLNLYWRHTEFREPQEQIIEEVLLGKDVFVLLPTGGGKSLCYQLPTLLLEGACLVISPLTALMKDQVEDLLHRNIPADMITADMEVDMVEAVFDRLHLGETKFLYVSPERLSNPVFLEHIKEAPISLIAVDEAHCISEWGQDFRPSYKNIKEFRNQICKVPIIALTATATPKVSEEILEKLGMNQAAVFTKSFLRENLQIVLKNTANKYPYLAKYLTQKSNQTHIVYSGTRKETEHLSAYLKTYLYDKVDCYHAGLSAEIRLQKQQYWKNSSHQTLVCTNAFGMGIDKEDVRSVVHTLPPYSLENYYQEIGRAGRDGKISSAIMLWEERDLKTFDEILKYQTPSQKEFLSICKMLYSLCQIAEGEKGQKNYNLDIQNLVRVSQCGVSKVKNVLNFLHVQEWIYYKTFWSSSYIKTAYSSDELYSLTGGNAYFMDTLFRHIEGMSYGKGYFNLTALSKKLNIEKQLLEQRLLELEEAGIIEFYNGEKASVTFLKERYDIRLQNHLWPLFQQIQRNKIRKWEEMKFFIRDTEFCKMKLIRIYFGEKNVSNCGKCSVCRSTSKTVQMTDDIINLLKQKPMQLDELCVSLPFYENAEVQEKLIELLDTEQVKMLDFRTYYYP